jgi:hypothetical protein
MLFLEVMLLFYWVYQELLLMFPNGIRSNIDGRINPCLHSNTLTGMLSATPKCMTKLNLDSS